MDDFERDCATWINTFDGLSTSCASASELCDGFILSEVMAQIAPEYFSYEVGKGVSTLECLKAGIEKYYSFEHSKNFNLDFIDLERLHQSRDLTILATLMVKVYENLKYFAAQNSVCRNL